MAVINIDKNWLYLAEGYTGSRATAEALLKLPGSINVGSHHETWPSLKKRGVCSIPDLTFSVVRHPLDIIATQCAKGSRHPVSHWLIRRYRHRDPFYFHRPNKIVRYERGISPEISGVIEQNIDIPIRFPTPTKKPWKEIFTKGDYKFACSTIPELFTLGYVDWDVKSTLRANDIDNYLKEHGDQKIHG
ncbi:MAG: hypothetical protein V3V68_05080 [Nitrosomonadaceae bacterium]